MGNPGILFAVTACAANAPMPSAVPSASAVETQAPGFQGTTYAEIAAEFARELVARREAALATTASGNALRARVEGTTESLAVGVLDHLFDDGLGGQCRYGEFESAIDDRLPGSVYATVDTTGYSLYDRMAVLLSAMEVDQRVERMPPVPIRPPPEFGSGPWGPLAVLEANAHGGDFAAYGGALRIDDTCVTAGGTTVVYRSAQTRWNADRETITFWDPLSDVAVEIRHGDDVRFGGGEFAPGGALNWANEPDPACSLEGALAVNSLGRGERRPHPDLPQGGG